MISLPRSRKNSDRKNLKSISKQAQKIQLVENESFETILLNFESYFDKKQSISKVPNPNLTKCIRQFLAYLKSIVDKNELKIPNKAEDSKLTRTVVNILNLLNEIYSNNDSVFPETSALSTICVAFLLINYFKNNPNNYDLNINNNDVSIQLSLLVYFSFFRNQNEMKENDFRKNVDLAYDQITKGPKNLPTLINEFMNKEEGIELKFRDAALFYGLLNCYPMLTVLINSAVEVFFLIFPIFIRLCNEQILMHEFHVYRLLNQYLKIYLEYQQIIETQLSQLSSFGDNNLLNVFKQTLPIIDSNWESPINGVNNLMKQNYQFLLELLIKTRLCHDYKVIEQLLIDQFECASNLPFECKAKYKKLTVLTQTLTKQEKWKLLPYLPFDLNPNFAIQLIKHLTINLLSTSIAEYYKSWVVSMVKSDSGPNQQENSKWSKIWLQPLTYVFKSEMIQSTVVQNVMLTHILPSTLENVPESINLLNKLSDCLYGQICFVRIFLKKYSPEKLPISFRPSLKWLSTILSNADDMTRAEGLALLVDEKFILKNRSSIFQIVMKFLRNNLNIDNATFRQKIICSLEHFYFKIINSICGRFDSETKLYDLNDLHRSYIGFLSETFNLLALSLCPGSSFQRKFTTLNLIGSILEMVKKDHKSTLINLIKQYDRDSRVPMKLMLLYGLVDKDDKIRRLCCEILILFSKSSLSKLDTFHFPNLVHSLSIHYIQSFRHQECHIGGLLYEYCLRIESRKISSIEFLVNKATTLFYSDLFRLNLLKSSQTDPLHGWILALNHCFTYDTFYEGILGGDIQSVSSILLVGEQLKQKVFTPTIQMAIDVLEYFLKLLTPNSSNKATNCNSEYFKDGEYEEEIDLEENYSSPSFLEMCESIKQIIQLEDKSESNNENLHQMEDLSSMNKFQLILSMCWLNLKESCFLLSNLTLLFADLLCLINQQNGQIDSVQTILLISPEELCQIGIRIVWLMQKCRHKGVIEASGVSLTKFTRAFLRIQYYLHHLLIPDSSINESYSLALKQFVDEILTVITLDTNQRSSITRRSAGLALIVQSLLIGEAESIHLDRIKPFNDDTTLYGRLISLLISISQSPIKDNVVEKADLPQANALHVLRSIIGTSTLSHLNYKIAADLFPICIRGFTCPHWQIRNSSLQLFGACVIRMLGQKKKTKTQKKDFNDLDQLNESESTITFDEFHSRYPNLLELICDHLESSNNQSAVHRPELVPVLALLASFTPIGQYKSKSTLEKKEARLKKCLIQYLWNHCWKIRMLAAKSLSNLLSIYEFKSFIIDSLSKPLFSSNHFHGLLCCSSHLIELKSSSLPDCRIEEYRLNLYKHFEPHFRNVRAFHILEPLIRSIFFKDQKQFEDLKNDMKTNFKNKIVNENQINLSLIKSNISFKKPDNIRIEAAQQMSYFIEKQQLFTSTKIQHQMLFEIAEILFILFEDEDRQVRFEAQRMASILFRQGNNKIRKFEVLSQNVAIDCFLRWMILQPNWDQVLFDLIYTRLAISKTYFQFGNDKDQIGVLFEKEEKNVFSEPYLINMRLVNFFIDHYQPKQNYCNQNLDNYGKLLKLIDIFQIEFERQFNSNPYEAQEYLMAQSIWRLPKLFCFIVSFYISLKLAIVTVVVLPSESETRYETTIKRIEDYFPFIQALCSNFHSVKFDLITCEDCD